ncbi:GNAT family N-acetyltransferase [Microlunatus parietis]|uniref:Putative acetyltransferase n=1 Tax=Microlunatus parietis TaxID=682979 RepID=A0A7Y9I529_9ACTN|nr:GNAT family N-acetyltransferase [Microlunatus parietis]NYE70430.1 putative acetyltransferase [Microlunatus parietis]
MKILVDDLSGPEVAALLAEHLDDMRATSPPESKHALDLDDLRRPEITFWSAYDGDELVGCGALKRLDATHAEVKSMRTASSRRGGGVASTLLAHLIAEACRLGYARLSLETGSAEFFAPAHRLYRRFGFVDCEPFADYRPDPNSIFLTLEL